jgi:4-amino-4-deoxy-L-arabinose transferase-like glycosyltransferase
MPIVSGSVLAVAGISVVALALRLAAFGESFFADELFTYEISTRPDLHAVAAGVRSDLEITPPLFFGVAWLFQQLGDPLIWLRVPSLIAGVATVPLIYVLGVRTVGRSAALVGSAFFALSPVAIFYATEARAYALMTLLVVLSTLALVQALDRNDRRSWAVLAVLEAGAMYTHYTSVFVIAAQTGWALWTRRDLVKPLLLSQVAAAALYLPWVPFLLEDREAPAQKVIGILEPFGLETAARHLARLADGGPFTSLSDQPGVAALILLGVAALIGVAGLGLRGTRGTRPVSDRVVLIAALAFAAPVGAALYSLLSDDMFVVRNLVSSLPALLLGFAGLLTALPRAAAAVALTLAFTAIGWGAVSTFERDNHRPDSEQAARYLEEHVRPGDVVLDMNAFPDPPGRALEVNLDPSIPVFQLGYPSNQERQALDAASAGDGRILMVRPEISVFRGAVPELVGRRFRPTETHTWPGLQPLSVVVLEPR